MTDPAPRPATVTCHNPAAGMDDDGAAPCPNADIPIPVADLPEGAAVVCGACGQPITDVSVGGGG
jgi:hypothetical protein